MKVRASLVVVGLILTCFLVSAAVAQTRTIVVLRSVRFIGNSRVATEDLAQAASEIASLPREYPTGAQLVLQVQQIEDGVTAFYVALGFYHISIDSFKLALVLPSDSNSDRTLNLYLHEGPQFLIRSIAISGARTKSEAQLLGNFRSAIGEPLDERVLASDIDETLKLYEEAGYPFAKMAVRSIIPTTLDSTHGEIAIQLTLDEALRARIGRIAIVGNSGTSADVVTRELRLPIGSYYNSTEVERARSRVERLGFFESVSDPELFAVNDSTVALLVRVKEANTSSIDGVLGYNPARTPTESGYINGFVNLNFRNISGTGRNGLLRYDREGRESQELEIRYLEPWLFGYPLNASVGFLQRVQDTTYVRTTVSGDLTLLFTEDISLVGSIAMDRVVPTDLPELGFSVLDSKTITTGLTGKLDTRDNTIAPHTGIVTALGATLGSKSIYGPGRFLDALSPRSVTLRTLSLDASVFLEVIGVKSIAAIGLHARDVTASGDTLEASDLMRLGGIRTLRGYREADFLVSRFVYTNLEYRFMTGRYSFLFLFSDIGYLFRDRLKSDPTEQAIQALSYGFGAQLESPLGIITVSIGLAKGESLDQAKLHFGLIKQF
jgi:outer membrane protein assembly factor BamA